MKLFGVLAGLMPLQSSADLPVHCLHHQVVGDWHFELSPLSSDRSSCGHLQPDGPDAQPQLTFVRENGPINMLQVSLREPSTAIVAGKPSGTWTMVYDEGFEVTVDNRVYFAFSRFEFVQNGTKLKNVSHCGATQVGWYRNAARTQWGCYIGTKVASGNQTEDAQPVPHGRPSKPSFLETEAKGMPAPPAESMLRVPKSAGFDQPMRSRWQQSVADALNLLQLGWRATVYSIFEGKTPRQLNRFAGVRRHRLHALRRRPARSKRHASSFLGLSSEAFRVSGHSSFDWRSKDGKNWLGPVMAQNDCGSCYTISSVQMLTARNRIRLNNVSEVPFSVDFPLFCSEYNQGCDGGYGFLQMKWSGDVGLVPERCSTAFEGMCQVAPDCDLGHKRYRAVNHHYVGGFYGGSSEEDMRRELVRDGPLVASFEPKEDFMYYQQGIYRSGTKRIHQEWEQVDHAVLLVGFGTEKGQDFWTMQNSWGTDWGEDGFFRMGRGLDESGCESIAVAASVAEEPSNRVLDSFIASLSTSSWVQGPR